MDSELHHFCVREHPRLVGALTLHCGDRQVAAELAQEALARACEISSLRSSAGLTSPEEHSHV